MGIILLVRRLIYMKHPHGLITAPLIIYRITYVFEWQTVYVPKGVFWCLFLELHSKWGHNQCVTRVHTLFYFLQDKANPQMKLKTIIFTYHPHISFAWFTFCWWHPFQLKNGFYILGYIIYKRAYNLKQSPPPMPKTVTWNTVTPCLCILLHMLLAVHLFDCDTTGVPFEGVLCECDRYLKFVFCCNNEWKNTSIYIYEFENNILDFICTIHFTMSFWLPFC